MNSNVSGLTLEPPDLAAGLGSLEIWAKQQGYNRIAGVDEVGRGPLAGPVVAAAVVLPAKHTIEGLADSKKLSVKKREKKAFEIYSLAEGWGLGIVGPRRIDQINIRQASLEAMQRAFEQMLALGVEPDLVMVDGRDLFDLPARTPHVVARAFIKGDGRSENIAAASIVAKVYRDALMQEYHAFWPYYGFDRHKGYPTAEHKLVISKRGPCEIHRMTFRGVRKT